MNQLSAEIFETQGKYTEAIAEYRKAIEKNPNALNLHFRLEERYLWSPTVLLPWSRRSGIRSRVATEPEGCSRGVSGRTDPRSAAEALGGRLPLRTSCGAEPTIPRGAPGAGESSLDQKRHEESIELLQRAVELLPQSEAAHYALMIAYRNAGKTEESLRTKEILEKLQRPPEGEFTDFLKRLGEKPAKQ